MEDKKLSRTRRKGWVHGYSGAYMWLKAEFWCFSHEAVNLYYLYSTRVKMIVKDCLGIPSKYPELRGILRK